MQDYSKLVYICTIMWPWERLGGMRVGRLMNRNNRDEVYCSTEHMHTIFSIYVAFFSIAMGRQTVLQMKKP